MFGSRKYIKLLVAVSLLVSFGWFFNDSVANEDEIYYKIDKGLFYLKEVFETITRNYVDELDPEGMSRSAIEGMLKDFDPYTVFFEDPGSHQMQMITRGKYGGVGMEIGIQNGRITVIAPMEDTPAMRAGIQAGDVILEIDGEPVQDMSLEEASRKLRGKVGTEVSLVVERPGVDEPISFHLVREEIILKDVTYYSFVEPGTAYFRLSAFSDKAARELKDAIRDLAAQAPIERVILDLRGNPGGLLTSAVEVANVFLPPGKLVVSTRGAHETENKFYTREQPLLPHQPLVVLVNGSSASASEIVAGAIQDLDRGVLVGETTFGKGLVQKVYPIDKISQAYLKITTAKYYTPSGRSIQKEDYKKNRAVFIDLSDSVEYNPKINYYTRNGRVVHGGGGIHPDIEVGDIEYDRLLQNLIGKGFFFRFAVDYLTRHPELKEQGAVKVDDRMVEAFRAFLAREEFQYEIEGERELQKFLEVAREKQYDRDMVDLVAVAYQKLELEKEKQFARDEQQIRRLLSAEFAETIGGSRARIESMLSYDHQLSKAIQVLHNMNQYQEILAIH